MFQSYVKDCKCVTEATSYLEVLNYSVSVARGVASSIGEVGLGWGWG